MSTDKHQILETITAVSRLITLAFKPYKTKIAIRDHNVVICEPANETYYGIKFAQGIDRYLNGDSREDIYILNHVISNFIEWYILPYKGKDAEIYEGLINMAKYLCVGLKKLQRTYGTGTVVGTLQYYVIVLTAVIEDRFYPELLYSNSASSRKSFLDEDKNDEDVLMYSTIFDVDKFRTFWTRDELKSICDQFDKCFRLPHEKDTIIFKPRENGSKSREKVSDKDNDDHCSVDDELFAINVMGGDDGGDKEDDKEDDKESDSGETIKEISKKFVLPLPRSKNNAIVKGHLVGIANILDTMDKRFRTMLNQSVKGTNH